MIEVKHDFKLDIATAHSRMARMWKNRECMWSQLVERCSETKRTNESVREYAKMNRDEQSGIKDVGGFVGGYLSGGRRKTANVMWRSVATLDIDYGTDSLWEDFTLNFNFAAMLYSTHKHTEENPRYRLVFPLSRQVRPDEYEPMCRKIAEKLGIDLFDGTTYQLARLFYYPSTSKDGQFVFEFQDGEACDPDEFLAQYKDYKDVSSWATSVREGEIVVHEMKKAGDPTEKPGIIGAFCRAYSIEEAIDTFLSDVYDKTVADNRYTYKAGSVAAGLVCYDHKFAYSNHETDPASKTLCNAFDLCRIHLYGVRDEGSRVTDVTRLPSYTLMQEFATKDKRVRRLVVEEKTKSVATDFADIDVPTPRQKPMQILKPKPDERWRDRLELDKRGDIRPTAANIMAVLENDEELTGRLWFNLFNKYIYVNGGLPWDAEATRWGNNDEANLRIYLENKYGLTGKDKISDCLTAVVTKNKIHPIREYLNKLRWDGTPRLDRLIIDYIGAEDNELTRIMTRKHFTAAVARVYEPGCKYDYCLILTGREGIGKSTLFNIMGGEWFSDSLVTLEGIKGMEQVQDAWIIEMQELGSMKRSEVEQTKAFLSRRNDKYRPPYGRVTEDNPRQFICCGTTNEALFLKGDTGNRRFWVIEVDDKNKRYKDGREQLISDRDQIWAEAVVRYRQGEQLYLSREMEAEARQRQETYNDNADDPMPEMVRSFLDMKLPPDWNTWELNRRRSYIKSPDPLDATGTEERTRVCSAEFICEVLGMNLSDNGYKYTARKVNAILDKTEGWERGGRGDRVNSNLYGRQRCFVKKTEG